jgi:hypothetical protein
MNALALPFFLFLIPFAPADDDPWQPVRDLAPGVELRVYKTGVNVPLAARLDHATPESLVVVTKTGQLSIPRGEIDRIDARRPGRGPLFKGTRVDRKINPQGAELSGNKTPGATTSAKTGLDLPVRSSFQTIYKRTASADR